MKVFDILKAQEATRDPSLVHSKSTHMCARSVRTFIERGGIPTGGRPGAAVQYIHYLPTIGFQPLAKLIGNSSQKEWTNTSAQPGDISVMSHGTYGHICMWNGNYWVSDFRQNNMWPYPHEEGTCFIFRYTGECSPALDFSGYSSFSDNPNFYSVTFDLPKAPIDVEFKGLWNLYKRLSIHYHGYPSMKFTPTGEIVLGDATPGDSGLSNAMFNYLARIESGGKDFGFDMPQKLLVGYDNKDARGHKTYGYGSLFFDSNHYMDQVKDVWTQEELEQVYIEAVKQRVGTVKAWASYNNVSLTQNQLDSIVSAVYNFGERFLKWNIGEMIKKDPNNPQIPEVWAHLSDKQASSGQKGLKARREAEAQWYAQK